VYPRLKAFSHVVVGVKTTKFTTSMAYRVHRSSIFANLPSAAPQADYTIITLNFMAQIYSTIHFQEDAK
jgi:hypothetical protein